MRALWSDLIYALRRLAKAPTFTLVAVLSLAIAIGAGTAIFSLLNAVLLRTLPVRDAHELRVLTWAGTNARLGSYSGNSKNLGGGTLVRSSFSRPVFEALRDNGPAGCTVMAFGTVSRITAAAGGSAATIDGLVVSGNFFGEYGADMLIGRALSPQDDRPQAEPVAVITHAFWQRHFHLSPEALGQTVRLNQQSFTVIGVLPERHVGPLLGDSADVYVPLAAHALIAPARLSDDANRWWLQLMARLKPGVNDAAATSAYSALLTRVFADQSIRATNPSVIMEDGAQGAGLLLRRRMASPLLAMLGVVAAVLAIACANVAGLLVARGAARHHEFAIRAAIGASRWALIRQSFSESMLIAGAGGAGGLLFAEWGKHALLHSLGAVPESFRIDLSTDYRVVGFLVALSAATALLFGLLPAIRAARADPLNGLKARSGMTRPRLRVGRVLVSAQIAVSVFLVAGAALLVRSFVSLVHVNPGFTPTNVLTFRIDPAKSGHTGAAEEQFYRRAEDALRSMPGVESVGRSSLPLVGGSSTSYAIQFSDRPALNGAQVEACELVVTFEYFKTLNIPIVLGRGFLASDTREAPPVAVVNEVFARTFFPGENPLGRTFAPQGGAHRAVTIVGVSRNVTYANLRDRIPPVMHFSAAQHENAAKYFAVRSVLPTQGLVTAVRRVFAQLDPNLPISELATQEDLITRSIALDRVFAVVCTGVAATGLLLSCLGLYGLASFNVQTRSREIGIRLALGAQPANVARGVVIEALTLAAYGIAIGLPAALAIARLIRSHLYGVSPTDAVSLAASVVLMVAVAVFAAWKPASRAASVDPVDALRAE